MFCFIILSFILCQFISYIMEKCTKIILKSEVSKVKCYTEVIIRQNNLFSSNSSINVSQFPCYFHSLSFIQNNMNPLNETDAEHDVLIWITSDICMNHKIEI